jgi:hypothetical protein
MVEPISLTVSVLALAVSAATAWLTLFRRGTVKMTRPTVIYLGPDATRSGGQSAKPKVYLRALLFSSSKRGRIVESMHVSVSRSETRQNFNIWVYGERNELVRGSGLFVGESGVAVNHHFLLPGDESSFVWASGAYQLNVYARLLGDSAPLLLFSQQLDVSPEAAKELGQSEAGLYFDWGADSSRYMPHVERRPSLPDPKEIIELLGLTRPSSGPPDGVR